MIVEKTSDPQSLYEVIQLVRPLYKALEASVVRELTDTGISVSQRAVLERLLINGPMTVPAVGRSLIAPRQFIQKVANELLAMGLIERRTNAAHKRSDLFCLTEDGLDAIRQITDREVAVMGPISEALGDAAVKTTREVMAEMIRAFRVHSDGHDKVTKDGGQG